MKGCRFLLSFGRGLLASEKTLHFLPAEVRGPEDGKGADVKVTREQVRKTAELARFDLSPMELEVYTRRLERLLGLCERLSRIPTQGVPLYEELDETPGRGRPDTPGDAMERTPAEYHLSFLRDGLVTLPLSAEPDRAGLR